MSIRAFITLSSLAVVIPASSAAQSRTPADYMAAIEGVQQTPGPNDLGEMTIQELMAELGVPGVTVAVKSVFTQHSFGAVV